MGGTADKKMDDESSSIASFEDVSLPRESSGKKSASKALVVAADKDNAAEDAPVPDILYVIQYRDINGYVLSTKKSDKPIETGTEGNDDDEEKKPVIEILTKVTGSTNTKHQRNRRRRHYTRDRDSDSSDYSSDYNSDDDNCVDAVKVDATEMVIHSKYLQAALSAVVGYYPGTGFIGERVTVAAPYRVLIHHRDALNQYKTNQPSCHDQKYKEKTMKHIDILLNYLDATFQEQLRDEERRHLNSPPAATFDWFWLTLKPGEVIYAKKHDHWRPFVLSAINSIRVNHVRPLEYNIHAWSIEYKRGKLERVMSSFSIRQFHGEQAIHTLPVIPAKFFPEDLEKQGGMTMAERQVQLGKLYWELSKRPSYKEYDGPLVPKADDGGGVLTGRVIVDAEGFDRYGRAGPERYRARPPPPVPGHHGRGTPPVPKDQLPVFTPRCSCRVCSRQVRDDTGPFANFEYQNPNKDQPPKNDLYYLALSTDIPAFLLGERRWGHVSIDLLKEVKPDREAFKYLVLDDEIKLTVKALIGKFASADGKVSPWPRDLVKNKGEGRIFLLHGSPGVGKTCTSECISELTHRPLLSLTSGDIITNMHAPAVEQNLDYFLTLGERYGALVLLDEADVYLEERRTKDLQRNGLVSVFLRALEYYRGVLFLTTNRVEAFDSAFTSRIHVALHYKKLTDDDRLRIWTNNFERLERDSAGKVYVGHSTRDFVFGSEDVRALKWNGREIRNALQTAVALAETEAVEDGCETVSVTDKHLQAVVKMSKGFKDFLRRRRGWAEEESDSDDEDDDEDDDDMSSSFEG